MTKLINSQTGEILDFSKTYDLEHATKQEVSDYFLLINTFEKLFKKERERVRKFVISKVKFVFDTTKDRYTGRFIDHGFMKIESTRIDMKKLKMNKRDYKTYQRLLEKYPLHVEQVRPTKF